ncbi:hypothetical protein [Streptomyces sp. AC154]
MSNAIVVIARPISGLLPDEAVDLPRDVTADGAYGIIPRTSGA